jgi:hypothetical protein
LCFGGRRWSFFAAGRHLKLQSYLVDFEASPAKFVASLSLRPARASCAACLQTLQEITVLAGFFVFPRSFPNLLPVNVETRQPWKTSGRFCSPPALEMGSNK